MILLEICSELIQPTTPLVAKLWAFGWALGYRWSRPSVSPRLLGRVVPTKKALAAIVQNIRWSWFVTCWYSLY